MAKATSKPATRRTAAKKPAAKKTTRKPTARKASKPAPVAPASDIDHFLTGDGLDSEREKTIGQHIGYR